MKKKIWIIIAVIIVIIVIVVLNLKNQEKGKPIEVAIVKKDKIITKVSASGELKAQVQVNITAEIIAKVQKLYFKEGDNIKKGDLIIQFDDVQANASYKLAEARMQQANQDFVRIKTLYEKNLISKGEFEQMQLSYETARAQMQQARDTYQKTRIYAPISGRIMKLNIEEGETAVMGTMNSQGTVIATLADLSRMIAIVKIDETDIPAIKVSQEVEVLPDALPDSIFKGHVTKVGLMPITTSLLSTEKTTDFEVEIEMEEFSSVLRPGMNVNTNIITNQKNDVLVVPVQAIGGRKIKDTLSQTIFLVRNGKAILKKIVIGVSSDTESEIIDGLVDSDTVITGPFRVLSKLKDNDRVKYKMEKAKDTDNDKNKIKQSLLQTRSYMRIIQKRA